jgi:glutathione S-transferase
MTRMQLFAHPFSSFSQKALIAFYENDIPFTYRALDRADENTMAEFKALWPLERFPILVDEGRTVVEATTIIEYLALHHPGPVALIPADPSAAVDVRMMDRVFDLYVSTAQARIVFNAIRPEGDRDPYGDRESRAMLETAYRWLEGRMKDRTWASGDAFSMADCAAAPALFYADWTHRIDASFANLHAYRRRLLARPSFARAVDEARPYRSYFPLGAPDRD